MSLWIGFEMALGSLSKSLRLVLIRLPEVNFPKNETLRMHAGCIQPHSRPQRPRSFWSTPRIVILGADQKERGLWGRE